ncbi:hypothetical protein VB773_19225 [Haloarculaceae archaeon H-GB2-1]|nr:hypothetical protein [Haloarculaceae archaeon H-GB2-1]
MPDSQHGVVEIHHVTDGAVDERGVRDGRTPVRAENPARTVAGRGHRLSGDCTGLAAHAREGDADLVHERTPCGLDGVVREVLETQLRDEVCKLCCRLSVLRASGLHHIHVPGSHT